MTGRIVKSPKKTGKVTRAQARKAVKAASARWELEEITLTLPAITITMLKAYATYSGGSLNFVAADVITDGLETTLRKCVDLEYELRHLPSGRG